MNAFVDTRLLLRSQQLSVVMLIAATLLAVLVGQFSPSLGGLLWVAGLVLSFPPVALRIVTFAARGARGRV
jgi:predicted membrane metal-binding protein